MMLVAIACCLATAPLRAEDIECDEDSFCDLDNLFVNTAGAPTLCPTFDYMVHDKNSGRVLAAKQTEANPASKPCPRRCATRKCPTGTLCATDADCLGALAGSCVLLKQRGDYCLVDAECPGAIAGSCALQAGCVTIRLPPAANAYVGYCSQDKKRRCTTNAHCTPGTCIRDANERVQPHVYSGVCQPGTASQFTFWREISVRNGQFIPLP